MKLLLDTHVVLWWLRDDPRLGPRAKTAIAHPQAELFASIVSFWELSIKARIGKMPDPGSMLFGEASDGGIEILDVRSSHLAALEELVRVPDHNDPFDHLILAQALAESATLVTGDRKMRRYGVPCFSFR